MAVLLPEVERVDWDSFLLNWEWRQGEHVALVGPTGQGKSTLVKAILPQRSHSVVLATKPADPTLDRFRRSGWVKIDRWPPKFGLARALLWPKFKSPSDLPLQQAVIAHALDSIFRSGRWAIYADELRYLTGQLGLQQWFELLWLQGRSLKISLIASTQRPRWVPLEMWSQSTHLFVWGTSDDDDLKRLGGLGGLSSRQIRDVVSGLPKYDCLAINTRTRSMVVTRAPKE